MAIHNVLFDSANGDTTTIDGMVIGGTTPAAGHFTNLDATGTIHATGAISGPGGTSLASAATQGANGLFSTPLPLMTFRNADGSAMAAAASSGKLGISVTLGTSEFLVGEAANSNTKTDTAAVEVVLPPWYVAGSNITVTANCQYNLGSGTIGTHTLAMAAYLNTAAGAQGSSLIATSAQTVPAAAGNVTFTITGTTLVPGSRLTLVPTLAIQDTGGSNITGQINSITLS